jgi:methylmalonyl-CoA mutase N-terminal domain/subunit
VADPLGGSWFVEELTDEMERRAEDIFSHVDSLGGGSMLEGCIAGIEENWFQGRIADSAYELERAFNRGERIVVGVNRFLEGNDEDSLDILRITNEDESKQRRRLADVKQDRNDSAVVDALDRLAKDAVDPEINLMPALIEASQVYATVGEMMNTMAGVFGRHVEVPTI